MSKHTAGAWKAHKTNLARSGVPEYQIHWSDVGECVAEVVHGEANAKLISAAPCLLEALMEFTRNAIEVDCGGGYAVATTCESLEKARAAIASLSGESNAQE